MSTVRVSTARPYNVTVERGLLGKLGAEIKPLLDKAKKILIVSDSVVAPLYLSAVAKALEADYNVYVKIFEAGEERKNLTTFGEILSEAAKNAFCRDDAFIALGGGVTGDITGFAAASYMRGIKYLQIPTTLLAAIDSSVGGKTGVDLPEGKNLVGAFHQPIGVFFDPSVLSTLPEKEWKNGLGEGIKYAILCGGKIKEILESGLDGSNLEEFCRLCVAYKADIVSRDEREGGLRQLLNLGHTVGHAEEKLSDFTVSHGEAVACGIGIMARAAYKSGELGKSDLDSILLLLEKYGLSRESRFGAEELANAAANDKKAHGSSVNAVTIEGFGCCKITKMTLCEFGEYIK